MKRFSKFITPIILVAFAIYFSLNVEDFKPLLSVDKKIITLLILIYITTLFISSAISQSFFDKFKKEISFKESLDFTITSSVANLVVPYGGGALFRAVYFKKKYDLSYTKFVSMLAGTYLISIFVFSFSGLVSMFLLKGIFNIKFVALNILFLLVFLISLTIILFNKSVLFKDKAKFPGLIKNIFILIEKIINGWTVISSNRGLQIKLIIFVVLNFLMTILLTKFEFNSIDINLNFTQLLLYSALVGVSTFIAFTPNAIGIREIIFILVSQILGITNQAILNVAVLDRGIYLIALMIVFLVIKFEYFRRFRFNYQKKA